jgi:S-methylmethionine-dependent homocysteine/selenocysteine methylase
MRLPEAVVVSKATMVEKGTIALLWKDQKGEQLADISTLLGKRGKQGQRLERGLRGREQEVQNSWSRGRRTWNELHPETVGGCCIAGGNSLGATAEIE